MADISNITLPDGDNYNLKDPVARTIGGSMDPILTKTYTGVIATANNQADGNLYAIKVVPDNYNNSWTILYKVTATIAGVSEGYGSGYEESYVYIHGMRNTYAAYKTWNNIRNTSYRPYYHLTMIVGTSTGIANGYSHILGVGLRSSYNPTTAANTRTITIDILDFRGCSISFFDTMTKYASVPGTGSTNYGGISEFDGYDQGETHTGDRNNFDRILVQNNSFKCGSTAITSVNIIVGDADGLYKHLKSGTAFDIRFPILYASSNVNANAWITNAYLSLTIGISTTQSMTLTQGQNVYIKGNLSGTTFTPISTTPLTQSLPSTEDGYEYIRLGYAYATGSIWLEPVHPIFAYRNGKWREVAGDAETVNGKTAITDLSSTGENGLQVTKSDDSTSTFKVSTRDLVRPTGLRDLNDPTLQTLVSTTRANRLAFLPADQIIIEQTIDGGTTWTDAGVNNAVKLALFSETRPNVYLPRIDNKPNLLCGLRITFTAMKYDVPDGTPETEKYNYWSSQYVKSTERYCRLKEMYFWLCSNDSSIGITVQRANGATPNNWNNLFNNSSFYMTGWSGCDYVSFSQGTFGGGTNQTSQPWNYRITLMTKGVNGTSTLGSSVSAQSISEIRGYGDAVWVIPNQYMANDHMYSKDPNQNVTFPAQVTATNFAGKINNHIVNSDVPSNAVFTDTKDLTQMTGTLGIDHGGTGATTLASGEALIGNGTGAVTTRAIRNNAVKGSIGWTSAAESTQLLTQNDIAYWNGRYNSSSSNLKYAEVGELKDAATYEVETAVANDSKLPTGAAVKSFVEGKGYVTTDTKNTAGSTDTSSKIFLVGAASQAANPQTYSDNEVYATNGKLSMKEAQIGGDSGPIARYNTTTKSLDFVFS